MLATALALLAAPALGGAPALSVTDVPFGTVAPTAVPPSAYLGLVPGHAVEFQGDGGAPEDVAFLLVSSGLAPVPVPVVPGAPLLLDPAGLAIVAAKPYGAGSSASTTTE